MTELLDRAARALYEHHRKTEAPDLPEWKDFQAKEPWRSRAAVVFKAIAGDPGHDATEGLVPVGRSRTYEVTVWNRICLNALGEK